MSSITRPSLPERDWAPIARDYAANELPVLQLCALHGVSERTLYRYLQREGLPLRMPAAGIRGRCQSSREVELAHRLLLALDKQMTEFESRRAQGASSPADSDRDARTLTTLVRMFDRLKALGAKPAGSGKTAKPAAAKGKPAHDADRLRNELAQRLEKLRLGLRG